MTSHQQLNATHYGGTSGYSPLVNIYYLNIIYLPMQKTEEMQA